MTTDYFAQIVSDLRAQLAAVEIERDDIARENADLVHLIAARQDLVTRLAGIMRGLRSLYQSGDTMGSLWRECWDAVDTVLAELDAESADDAQGEES